MIAIVNHQPRLNIVTVIVNHLTSQYSILTSLHVILVIVKQLLQPIFYHYYCKSLDKPISATAIVNHLHGLYLITAHVKHHSKLLYICVSLMVIVYTAGCAFA